VRSRCPTHHIRKQRLPAFEKRSRADESNSTRQSSIWDLGRMPWIEQPLACGSYGGEREIDVDEQSEAAAAVAPAEIAQLSGGPALVDAQAAEPVETLLVPPAKLRAIDC
jgi:hypothetical protein